jgi:hypothetical protein
MEVKAITADSVSTLKTILLVEPTTRQAINICSSIGRDTATRKKCAKVESVGAIK